MQQIFPEIRLLRGNTKIPFPSSVLHFSKECLPVIKNSGIRKSRHQWPNADIHRIPSWNTSCKQPSVSCVEAHAPVLLPSWLLLPVSCCQVSLHIPGCKKRKRAILHRLTRASWHTVHWYTLRKHHLLHFHCRLCFKLRQLKLIECKCLSPYCQLYNVSRILIHIHRTF